MPGRSKFFYWAMALLGIATWTAGIIGLSGLPLPTQVALSGMAVMACLWGHAVLFPKPVAAAPAARPARPLPLGRARTPTRLAQRNLALDLPPGELPTLLREPFEEAARMEAHRLAEAISAAGIFGPVNIRLQPDGMALVAPVQAEAAVRLPAAILVRLAQRLTSQPDRRAEPGAGHWPGEDLAAAIVGRLEETRPAQASPAPRPSGRASRAGLESV
ncbi:hypothetical protein ACLF3G_18775 [Falsiroseomonas sp. HC035]|uniref:hypothetical protein n=1 Tax=Falsiroseomonas sp. HC035 TaxID=3390999 RepID=UPI003D312184